MTSKAFVDAGKKTDMQATKQDMGEARVPATGVRLAALPHCRLHRFQECEEEAPSIFPHR